MKKLIAGLLGVSFILGGIYSVCYADGNGVSKPPVQTDNPPHTGG